MHFTSISARVNTNIYYSDIIASGNLKNRAGKQVSEKLDAGLLRADGKWLYPIREEIPVMLLDEAIPVK